jgi:C1A family cysteine protease
MQFALVLQLLLRLTVEIIEAELVHTEEEYQVYLEWEKTFGDLDMDKRFEALENESPRMETIINEFRKISEHNEKFEAGTESFTQKLWEKSVLSEEKRKVMITGFKIIDIEKVLKPQNPAPGTFQSNPMYDLFTAKSPKFPAAPKALDWRDFEIVQPVQDQGSDCLSCWAFSAIGAIEGAYALATGKTVKFSEQQLIDCNFHTITGNWGCEVSKNTFGGNNHI